MIIGIARPLLAVVPHIQLPLKCGAYAPKEFVAHLGEGDVVDSHVRKDSGYVPLEFGDELEGCEMFSGGSPLL